MNRVPWLTASLAVALLAGCGTVSPAPTESDEATSAPASATTVPAGLPGPGGGAGGGAAGGGQGGGGGAGGGGSTGQGGGVGGGSGGLTAAQCFAQEYLNPTSGTGPDYDQFKPVLGSHCRGTNHQAIQGVQRVVFLGDSVTVGTPPTNLNAGAVYRAILAKKLAAHFNLAAPGPGWGGANPLTGVALPAESGAFASCAKWGARTDDLMKDSHQVEDCIPANKRNLRHLAIITVGGNDVAAMTKEGGGTSPQKSVAQLQADAQGYVDNLRAAIAWMKNPANVPGGVDVVFANNYEFTDGTGDVASCPGASVSGIEPWQDKQAQTALVVWMEEQYMKIAVDTQTDLVFMLESFCGHGYQRNNPSAVCYRGPNQPLWFDSTCIHPNNDGHAALADLFFKTIAE